MSLQIKSIVLYNYKGRIRILPFKLGAVNIITGRSGTGKSALIRIVEYCLGTSDFSVPEGVIRDNVAWYGVIYQHGETQFFIAKPAPKTDQVTQSSVYWDVATEIILPQISELKSNTNDSAVIEELSRRIGISPNLNIPGERETRQPLEANIKHTHYYLFQEQSLISNEKMLFHEQEEQYMPQAIKDTLPYFIGAVREDHLKLEQELRLARRSLRLAQQNLREAEDIISDSLTRGQALIAEAQQVGLLDHGPIPEASEDVLDLLSRTQNWKPNSSPSVPDDQLLSLQQELNNFKDDFARKKEQIQSTSQFAREADGYTNEATIQRDRLEAVTLFEDTTDVTTCPLCSSRLSSQVPKVLEIRKGLELLRRNLESVEGERPRLRDYLKKLEDDLENIRRQITEKQFAIDAILEEQGVADQIKDTNTRIARVVGRISLYLDTVKYVDEKSFLRERVNIEKNKVQHLESLVDPDEVDALLTSKLNVISEYMTDWAKYLKLEYPEYRYRLDIKKLTTVVDRPDRPIPMDRIGSGHNWLGSHLITLLALHRFFAEQRRPVPGFIMLDQPSQVYFPNREAYKALEGKANELDDLNEKDADLEAIERIFNLFFDVVEMLFPGLQIIITEHANIGTAKFQSSLVEDPWTGGRALIPESWINE